MRYTKWFLIALLATLAPCFVALVLLTESPSWDAMPWVLRFGIPFAAGWACTQFARAVNRLAIRAEASDAA